MSFGDAVNEYYVDKIRWADRARARRLAAVKTRKDAAKYVAEVRRKLDAIFRLPERTPLEAKSTGLIKRDGFTIEKLYYFSRPNYPVTANFYLPAKRKGRIPAALIVCGHAVEGKACDTYASAAVGLVLKGFAVLVIDPVEQGERKQYSGVENPRGGLCANHNMMGKQMSLEGEWFGTWRTWDAIRGLDYLETRPEVDASRLVVTGNSGGGTLTTWVAAADPRPIAVAPSCYVTSWLHNIENELPADIEQIPPGVLVGGMEMGDLLLAHAPRDIMLIGQKNDFFDARGVRETFEEVKRINSLLGGRTEYFIGPTSHGFTVHNRQAMYGFMMKSVGIDGVDATEPKFKLPTEKETYAANGDVFTIKGARNVRDFIAERADALDAARKPLSLAQLRTELKKRLVIGKVGVPHYRVLRTIDRDGSSVARFALETEKGRPMAVLMRAYQGQVFSLGAEEEVTIVVPDVDARTELLSRREALLAAGASAPTYFLDVRGMGEMMPTGTDMPEFRDFYSPYQFDFHYASIGQLFSEPILGGKVRDVLAAVGLLKAQGARKIHLEGVGLGCIPALVATVLSDGIATLSLRDGIESFGQEARKPVSLLPLSHMIPGVLEFTDVPEMKAALGNRLV